MKITFLKELIIRWKAEIPFFWSQVRKVALIVVSSCTAVWVANTTMNLGLDDVAMTIIKYVIAYGAGVGVASQFTIKDPSNIYEEQNKGK
jgi:hypothetical protein